MVLFLIGLFIGIVFGFIVCAVLSASRREEEIFERTLKEDEIRDTPANH